MPAVKNKRGVCSSVRKCIGHRRSTGAVCSLNCRPPSTGTQVGPKYFLPVSRSRGVARSARKSPGHCFGEGWLLHWEELEGDRDWGVRNRALVCDPVVQLVQTGQVEVGGARGDGLLGEGAVERLEEDT